MRPRSQIKDIPSSTFFPTAMRNAYGEDASLDSLNMGYKFIKTDPRLAIRCSIAETLRFRVYVTINNMAYCEPGAGSRIILSPSPSTRARLISLYISCRKYTGGFLSRRPSCMGIYFQDRSGTVILTLNIKLYLMENVLSCFKYSFRCHSMITWQLSCLAFKPEDSFSL